MMELVGLRHLFSTSILSLPSMFCWKLLQNHTGLNILTDLLELSYARMRSRAQTLFLKAINLGKLETSYGNSHSMLFIISQNEKSATVTYPKYQSFSLQFFSSSTNFGCIFSSQQNSGDCWGLRATLQLLRFIWQMRPMMLSLMSCLLLNESSLRRSRTELPRRESLPALRTMYQIIPCWPVTTKSPSLRKGSPLITQSLASFFSQLSHYSGVKKRSRQGNSKYSQRSRQTCALARTPKYPITIHCCCASMFIQQYEEIILNPILITMFKNQFIGEQITACRPIFIKQVNIYNIDFGDSSSRNFFPQKKKNPLLISSGAFFLKSWPNSTKGSLGSSSMNSKFLKNLSSQEDMTSVRKGLLHLLSQFENESSSNERLLKEAGLFSYSSMGEAGSTGSPLTMSGTSNSKPSIIFRFLGCLKFLFFVSRSGLKFLTQARRMPTFQLRLLAKLKLQNSPNRSWQQQSSSDFLEIPTALAAYERLIFFMPDLILDKCNDLHCFTSQIDSPIVLSLLLSFFSLPYSNPDSMPLSDSVFWAYSSRLLNRTMIICVSNKFLGTLPLTSAFNLERGTKTLASGSQIETLWSLSGQYCAKRVERSTVSQNKHMFISNSKD